MDDRTKEPQAIADEELVALARKGDLAGFGELVRRYQRQANAIAQNLLNNREDALEVVQEAFLRGYDKIATLENPSRFGPWFLRILTNQALNYRRSRALRKTVSLDVSDDGETGWVIQDRFADSPFEQVAGDDLRRLIRREIERLPEKQRTCLVMFSIEKIPQKQVAEIMGCSTEAVKWHVFMARKKLKEVLQDYL